MPVPAQKCKTMLFSKQETLTAFYFFKNDYYSCWTKVRNLDFLHFFTTLITDVHNRKYLPILFTPNWSTPKWHAQRPPIRIIKMNFFRNHRGWISSVRNRSGWTRRRTTPGKESWCRRLHVVSWGEGSTSIGVTVWPDFEICKESWCRRLHVGDFHAVGWCEGSTSIGDTVTRCWNENYFLFGSITIESREAILT